jgi:predicted esterase
MQKTTGHYSFSTTIPYDLINNGNEALFIYLHGYMQNKYVMQRKMEGMLQMKGVHVFPDAPYPVYDSSRSRPVEKWGRAWYLYDGIQAQFLKSLEECSSNLQSLMDVLISNYKTEKVCLIGYSMGAYQAGYYMLSRPDDITHSIQINGRIKTEAFSMEQLEKASSIALVALHGSEDRSVYPEPQKAEIEKLKRLEYDAEFELVECGHELEPVFTDLSVKWLEKRGYRK